MEGLRGGAWLGCVACPLEKEPGYPKVRSKSRVLLRPVSRSRSVLSAVQYASCSPSHDVAVVVVAQCFGQSAVHTVQTDVVAVVVVGCRLLVGRWALDDGNGNGR